MLYLISGAVAAGKSSVAKAVANRLPNLVHLEEGRRPVRTAEERIETIELWIQDALDLESTGTDAVFGTQSPLGEVLASPSAIKLEGIAACLLDVQDAIRLERWTARGVSQEWPVTMDHFCWAAFHRLHARDPQFEQRVLVDRTNVASIWSRWTGWTADDPRWSVLIVDNSGSGLAATVDAVAAWIGSTREDGTALTRDNAWWA